LFAEAGKLAMNSTEGNATNNIAKPRRIVIRKQMILPNNAPKAPNILKRTDEIVKKVALPTENNLAAKVSQFVQHSLWLLNYCQGVNLFTCFS
jgi:hypothetical protein